MARPVVKHRVSSGKKPRQPPLTLFNTLFIADENLYVEAIDSDIEVFIIVEQANFGALGAGLTRVGILLDEISGRLRQCPVPFVQLPIDGDCGFHAHGRDRPFWLASVLWGSGRLGQARGQAQGKQR